MPVRSVRKRLVPAVAGLAAALLLTPTGSASAEPRPTVAQAKTRLDKLQDQADKMVERYNTVAEKYKSAKRKYGRLDQELSRETGKVADLREDVVSAASNMYQYGGLMSVPGIVSQDDPAGLLSGLAVANQVTAGQAQTLEEFDNATKGLRTRRGKAKSAYDDMAKILADVAKEKKQVDKLVGEQERLLRRLNQFNAGDPNSRGIKYTGTASGNAKVALQFAFAQVGKPYRYGATGPGAYDCSGFAQASWAKAGVRLPRTTYSQWAWGSARRVSLNDLQPGDLLFSNGLGHMGIYAGAGKMVHAPHTGDVVKVVTLDSYWRGRLVGAVRP
ncbi:C40 family peptidase [Sphaerisporangium corydalis]|uniref:C40 family peptidase n=1 Tax=Sphaerisporangium corydalis TaxID=1441875 RepID=A0ABV9ENK4_9ACTN|nr:C40 family peptidase [Sphaerisporangium corydalis]